MQNFMETLHMGQRIVITLLKLIYKVFHFLIRYFSVIVTFIENCSSIILWLFYFYISKILSWQNTDRLPFKKKHPKKLSLIGIDKINALKYSRFCIRYQLMQAYFKIPTFFHARHKLVCHFLQPNKKNKILIY